MTHEPERRIVQQGSGQPADTAGRWRHWIARLPPALAISLGLAADDLHHAGRIRAAQIAGIVRLTPLAMVANCLSAGLLLVTLQRVGFLRPIVVGWAVVLFAGALYYSWPGAWRRSRDPDQPASRRAIRRAVLHGALCGAAWGVLPVITFAGAPPSIQLLIGCVTAGAMYAGGFVLATVPLAGWCYVGMVMAGYIGALLNEGGAIHLGLTALLLVGGAAVIANLTWTAQLFVEHYLAEARLRREVAARERAQAEAAHGQRMTAMGQMAGGIAHDFNNILHVVAGNATLIARTVQSAAQQEAHSEVGQDGLVPGSVAQVQQLAGSILEAAERGAAISGRLLVFARQDGLRAEPLEPADFLASVTTLLRHTVGSRTLLLAEAAPGLPRLLADRAQLETVLVNLAANARDAMPHGGTLTLSAACETVQASLHHPTLPAGDYVRLSMTDTGTGMDATTLARATEPFFTTKPAGQGTGLGLSMAKGFAEQSGGALGISSAPGEGTTLTLWLPATDAPAAPRPADPAELTAYPAIVPEAGKAPHVLVVEDDPLVRRTMIRSLAAAGFVLSDAEDAAAALDRIDRGEPVDILLTDYAMPGMNGIELIIAAHRRRPGLPAILLTGHVGDVATGITGGIAGGMAGDAAGAPAGDANAAEAAAAGRFILLRKPVPPAQLAARLAAALGSTTAP